MPGQHARKSPSKAKLLHACSGAFAYIESLPSELRSAGGMAARLGTATHFLIETALTEGKSPGDYEDRLIQITLDKEGNEEGAKMLRPAAKLPKSPEEKARTFIVDGDMIGNADMAYDYVLQRCEELGVSLSALQLETRTNPVPDRDDTSGTADITIDAWPVLLEVVDYKNGRLVVEHEDNPQVLSYLAGRAHDTGWIHDEYKITVIQPNGRHHEGKVRTFPISREDLLAFVVKHREKAELADTAEDELRALGGEVNGFLATDSGALAFNERGEEATWADAWLSAGEHCSDGFCDARHTCPVYRRWVEAQAKVSFADEPPTPEDYRVNATAEALEVMKWAPALRARISSASQWLNNEAQAGRMPPGKKYVRAKGKREFGTFKKDPKTGRYVLDPEGEKLPAELLADAIMEAGFVGPNEKARLFEPLSLITGPQVEKLITGKGSKDRKAAFSNAFLVKRPGGLKLVDESDPGEAVIVNPSDDFADDDYSEEGEY